MYKGEPISVNEKFKKECEEMSIPGTPAYNRAKEIADTIMQQLDKNDNGGIKIIEL